MRAKAEAENPSLMDFRRYLPLVGELVQRDLKLRYRRSVLGYVWSMLNPLLMMTVQGIVFSQLLRTDVPNFFLYLVCGNALFSFMNESTTMGIYSIVQNAGLIKKVYIPKYIFPLSKVASSFVNLLFSLVAVLLVMIFTRATFHWQIIFFWIPLVFLFLFSCGLGMLLSALNVYFRDTQHLYGVVTMAWMYVTPIFWPVSILSEQMRRIIVLNPMYQYITMFRGIVMDGVFPDAMNWLYCVICSALSFGIGALVFNRLQKNFILYI